MPEGDTIYLAARTLNRALSGKIVTKFESQLPQLSRVDFDTPLVSRKIESVDAAGKWLRVYFSGDLILLTHMLMSGSWHIYRIGEAWKRARIHMRVAVYTETFVAIAFNVPIAEFHTATSLTRHRSVRRLGPDVLSAEFDETAAAGLLRAHPNLEVGEALLRQSIVAGLGNVYKSEVCFASGVNPFRRVVSLSELELNALMSNARKFLLANVADGAGDQIVTYSGMRRTTRRGDPSALLWVYKRKDEPCRRCGQLILSRKQGEDARVTFWCPQCQALNANG